MTLVTDNRPVYTLTVTEDNLRITSIVKSIFAEMYLAEQVAPVVNPRIKINGIRGLGDYLEVSIPTAQKLKSSKKFPFYESGNKVFFFSDEVEAGLKVAAKEPTKKLLK
jgi:hypothetical protein